MMVDHELNTEAHLKDMVNRIPAPGTRCVVGISGTSGLCPLGFMQEDVWEVDPDGKLSFPLCPPAVEAIRPLIKKLLEGRDFDSRGECICPHVNSRLSFVVHSPTIFDKAL